MMITSPIIQTNSGPVRGLIKFTETAKIYNSFEGIPYAEAPVNDLQFRDPIPITTPWTEVLEVTYTASPCYHLDVLQPNGPVFMGGPDCLNLNVYTPDLNPRSKLLPVLVYIHEGGFQMGSNSTDLHGPDYLLEQDVIVVNINYRLGVYGFLSFKSKSIGIPGNAGLKDQLLAFKWIKENIEQFGGDANNITAIGINAGAASVHYHFISPLSEGIFHRAILISGSALNPWAVVNNCGNFNLKLAQSLGYQGEDDEEEILKIISNTDPQTLTLASLSILSAKEKLLDYGAWTPFLPTVEPYDSQQCFLPKSPLELGRNAWSKNIDIIVGGVANEGFLFGKDFTPEIAGLINGDARLLVPLEIRSIADGQNLKQFYFGDTVKVEKKDEFMRYMGDKNFWHGTHRLLLQRLASSGSGKTYLYYSLSEHAEQFQLLKFLRTYLESDMSGSSHGEEISLIFRTAFDPDRPKIGPGAENSKKLISVITNFAKKESISNDWLPLVQGQPQAMLIKNQWSFEKLPITERLKLWDSLYDKGLLC